MHERMYACMCVCVCACVRVCVCACVSVCIQRYIHTYTYKYVNAEKETNFSVKSPPTALSPSRIVGLNSAAAPTRSRPAYTRRNM